MKPKLALSSADGSPQISIAGSWRLAELEELPTLAGARAPQGVSIEAGSLQEIDTAGALALIHELEKAGVPGETLRTSISNPAHKSIINLVLDRMERPGESPVVEEVFAIERLGRMSLEWLRYMLGLTAFLGETLCSLALGLVYPRLFRPREFFVQLELVFLKAVPIVAMVTFLIGLVFAYLFASQSVRYGANIFIVDAVAIAMCRELSPIIVAIIMAGRSGSAFTAQIGTMKLNEEIDALQVLGLSPSHVLVIPRVLALILSMPLLVFVGGAVGIAAGALVANLYLGITPTTYIDRLQVVLPIKHVLIGLIKAPVFAFFIANIGCHMGLTVENNARSVGLHTTSTVVQSIVSVILLNAAFAVLLVELRL